MALPFVKEKVEGGKVEYAPAESTLIDLYKYYEGVGSQARGQMLVTVNWLLSFAIGVLVYAAQNGVKITPQLVVCRTDNGLAVIAPIAGLGLCALALVTIREFRAHVSRNWMRATRCKVLVDDLYRLVSEEEVQSSDKTQWPKHLRSYDAFEAYPLQRERQQRVGSIFAIYNWLSIVLAAMCVIALRVSITLEFCPAPRVID
jgi:hypothetical protein